MLVLRGDCRDSARLLTMRSACNVNLGMLCCAAYAGGALTGIENGLEVLGLVSRGAELKPKGESPCAETGERVSVADCGGVNVKPPKAGLMPVGEIASRAVLSVGCRCSEVASCYYRRSLEHTILVMRGVFQGRGGFQRESAMLEPCRSHLAELGTSSCARGRR
jgi:hypothetical protein